MHFISFVLLLLPPLAEGIEARPFATIVEVQPGGSDLVQALGPYQDGLYWGSEAASVVAFAGSFLAPAFGRRGQGPPGHLPD